jgi:hypothetical protein
MACSGVSLLSSHPIEIVRLAIINAFLICGVHILPLPTSVVSHTIVCFAEYSRTHHFYQESIVGMGLV